MNPISHLAPRFDHYITLERLHPSNTYYYKARSKEGVALPESVIEATLHKSKSTSGSWLYVAVPASASLASLLAREKLYVGSQTSDRMFRGDGMVGRNFHHAEMRAGSGEDNLMSFLRSSTKVHIYHISAASIAEGVVQTPSLSRYKPLLHQPPRKGTHVGYYFEQLILYTEAKEWRWNTAGAKDIGLLRGL